MDTTRPLRRAEASAYLLEKHGLSRTAATLAKLAATGGGPPFRKANRTPIYDPRRARSMGGVDHLPAGALHF